MFCPLTGSISHNQLMKWKPHITEKKPPWSVKANQTHKHSGYTSVKWLIMRVPRAHGCCNVCSLMLPYHQSSWPLMTSIHSTTWFIRISMETLVGVTECSWGLKLALKLFWFHGRMQRDRETLMKFHHPALQEQFVWQDWVWRVTAHPENDFHSDRVCLSINLWELVWWICNCKFLHI